MVRLSLYRPICLMDIKAEIFNCISESSPAMITHHTHMGFIPGIQDGWNLDKSINVIHHVNRVKEKTQDHSQETLLTKFTTSLLRTLRKLLVKCNFAARQKIISKQINKTKFGKVT